jgi:rhomboid protease GluP
MWRRQRTGSVLCPGCGRLVGAAESTCPFCGRAAPGMWGFTGALRKLSAGGELGVWPLVAGAAIVVYVASLAVDMQGVGLRGGLFGLLSPSGKSLFGFGASGGLPVFQYGRWWTPLSASWLHGNLLHILLNFMGIRQLLPLMAHVYGPGRTLIIYCLAGVLGFAATTASVFMPGFVTAILGGGMRMSVGASASLFGLIGALLHYSRRTGSRMLSQQLWSWALPMFVFGLLWSGVIDNWAHLGGFAGGWLLSRWLDPLRPERPDHVIAGVLCLLASFAAVGWSLFTARAIF